MREGRKREGRRSERGNCDNKWCEEGCDCFLVFSLVPCRDIGSIWDISCLAKFLGDSSMNELLDKWLDHYTNFIVPL